MTRWFAVVVVVVGSSACLRNVRPDSDKPTVEFEPVTITGDLELDKLNDEELFAAGTSFYAAEDYAQAARYFGRLYNAGLALEKVKMWDEAYQRFSDLSDPKKGTGDALDAAYRVAEVLYHL